VLNRRGNPAPGGDACAVFHGGASTRLVIGDLGVCSLESGEFKESSPMSGWLIGIGKSETGSNE
jgi:hypothetical protein